MSKLLQAVLNRKVLVVNKDDQQYKFAGMLKESHHSFMTLKKMIECGWAGVNCVYVLSTGRTGTMQLAALLDLSKDISAFHEPFPVLIASGYKAFYEGCSGPEWQALLHGARDELVAQAHHQHKIYVETSNRLTYMAEALLRCYPASKFMHVHRHPYEVISSGMMRKWYCGSELDPLRIAPRHDDPFYSEWRSFTPLQKNAWFWWRVNSDALTFLEKKSPSQGISFKVKSIFECDIYRISQLFKFLGASMPDEKLIIKNIRKKLNAQKKGAFPASHKWPKDQIVAVQRIVGSTANKLGYQTS